MLKPRKPTNVRKVTLPTAQIPSAAPNRPAATNGHNNRPGPQLNRPIARHPPTATSKKQISRTSHATAPRPRAVDTPRSSSPSLGTPPPTNGKRSRQSDGDGTARQRVKKRSRAALQQSTPWSSDDDDDDDDDDTDFLNFARPVSKERSSPIDKQRVIWKALLPEESGKDVTNGDALTSIVSENMHSLPIIHAKDLTSRGEYQPTFGLAEQDHPYAIELQYPSQSEPERYELVEPREAGDFRPLDDIIQTVEQTLLHYFRPDISTKHLDDNNGIPRRLKRAVTRESFTEFSDVLAEYNTFVRESLADGSMVSHLRTLKTVPFQLVERVLSQIYSRTVSPEVKCLAAYENGSDNVYGELLPRLVRDIIDRDAGPLTSSSTFIDLGSGVGNVVLQAALQTGCESWGIEQMPNPCKLASAQKHEFEARCSLWGINPGPVHLLRGDFVNSTEIDGAIRRADIVLVNNKAFLPDLNDRLVWRFLDLKNGTRIVSLKNFVPFSERERSRQARKEAWKDHDPRNQLKDLTVKDYGSGCVSWTDQGGQYYIVTKLSPD